MPLKKMLMREYREMLKAVIAKKVELVDRRTDAHWLREQYRVSERQVCGLLSLAVKQDKGGWQSRRFRGLMLELSELATACKVVNVADESRIGAEVPSNKKMVLEHPRVASEVKGEHTPN